MDNTVEKINEAADKLVSLFKYGFVTNEITDVAIPEYSILKESALRTINKEIADGSARKRALEWVKRADEAYFWDSRKTKRIRYPEVPAIPALLECDMFDNDAGLKYINGLSFELIMENLLEDIYELWIKKQTDYSKARKLRIIGP